MSEEEKLISLKKTLDLTSLQWRHNGHDSISNHQPHDCLLNRLFKRRSKKTSKLRVTGLCVGDSPGTDEFPAQMASNAENVSIRWRHHVRSKSPPSASTQFRLNNKYPNTYLLYSCIDVIDKYYIHITVHQNDASQRANNPTWNETIVRVSADSTRRNHNVEAVVRAYMVAALTSMMTSSNGNIFRVIDPLWGEFISHRWIALTSPGTRSFDIFFDLHLNERLSKQSWRRWLRHHRAHYDAIVMSTGNFVWIDVASTALYTYLLVPIFAYLHGHIRSCITTVLWRCRKTLSNGNTASK